MVVDFDSLADCFEVGLIWVYQTLSTADVLVRVLLVFGFWLLAVSCLGGLGGFWLVCGWCLLLFFGWLVVLLLDSEVVCVAGLGFRLLFYFMVIWAMV